MALVLNDRVLETSTTTGTGSFTLAGAPSGFQTFATGMAVGSTTYYCIVNTTGNEWEVGLGTLSGSTVLARTTVYVSSNSGSAVNFSAGTKNVFCTYPASRSVNLDANGFLTIGTPSGTTFANSLAQFYANTNSYAQLLLQNTNAGNAASTDLVLTADTGTDTTNYFDVGINSSTYSEVAYTAVGTLDSYAIALGGNLAIIAGTSGKSIKFFQGGTLTANEVARFAPTTNNLLIGTTTDTAGIRLKVVGGTAQVAGVIESTSGGFKFPNGTTQTVAYSVTETTISLGTTPIQSYNFSVTDALATTTSKISFNPSAKSTGVIVAVGAITAGSSYTNGTYTNVPLTGGTGTGATATIVVTTGAVSSVTIASTGTGSGYAYGDTLSASAANIGGTGSGFSVPVALLSGGGDELEMDGIKVAAVCTTNGTISVYIDASPGYIAGGRTFAYTLG